MSALTTESDIEVRVRAEVYAFLAGSVQYPRDPVTCGVLESVRFDDSLLDTARSDVVEASTSNVRSLQAAHRVLFPAVESQDAPSYETAYSRGDVFRQGQVMADAAGFYRAHGLGLGGTTKDRPDGIGPELEFMGFLAVKQVHARAAGLTDMDELCVDTQRSFLRDHLGRWGPDYGRRMAGVSDHRFYGALGRLLTAWINTDMDFLSVEPRGGDDIGDEAYSDTVPVADPRVRWDELSCGGAV
jgi:TorA maturation chaperone TorD